MKQVTTASKGGKENYTLKCSKCGHEVKMQENYCKPLDEAIEYGQNEGDNNG